MNEQNKKQIIIVAVLAVVLAAVLFYQLVLAEGPGAPSAADRQARTDAAPRRAPRDRQRAVHTPALREVDIDLEALKDSVDVQPLDYARDRIARNPMAPLVGTMLARRVLDEDAPVITEIEIDRTASKQISGIIYGSGNPVAIVDDIVVHVGYVFPSGVEVYAIEKNRVLFQAGDTIIPVELKEY